MMELTLPCARAKESRTCTLSASTDTNVSPGRLPAERTHSHKELGSVQDTHHIAVRKLSISASTKGERNSGLAGEVGERMSGWRDFRATLKCQRTA